MDEKEGYLDKTQLPASRSVRELLDGKFDHIYQLGKAERDFERLLQAPSPIHFYDILQDFVTAVKHYPEWLWNTGPDQIRADFAKPGDLIEQFNRTSGEFRAFDQLSNTFKHFDRDRMGPNSLVKAVDLVFYEKGEIPAQKVLSWCYRWGGDGQSSRCAIAVITDINGDKFAVFHIGKVVLKFLKQFSDQYDDVVR